MFETAVPEGASTELCLFLISVDTILLVYWIARLKFFWQSRHLPDLVDTIPEKVDKLVWKSRHLRKTLHWFAKRLEAQSLKRVSMSVLATKLNINLKFVLIFSINFSFPAFFLFSFLLMSHGRSLHSYTHVWASVVVEVDEWSYLPCSVLNVFKPVIL